MLEILENKSDCYGCELCVNVCKKNAITMQEDHFGFLYPKINESICINCLECKRQCPALLNIKNRDVIETKIGYLRDQEKILNSASGGIAQGLIEKYLMEENYVCSVIYTDNYTNAKYFITNSILLKEKFYGSKYYQAKKGEIYRYIKKILNEGKKVLFIGLPCDVVAVKGYIGNNENLVTVDLICQGVTSRKLVNEGLENLIKKNGNILYMNPRYKKDKEWGNSYLKISFSNGKNYEKAFNETSWGKVFMVCSRESCYKCKIKGGRRLSDITLGDYWTNSEEKEDLNKSGTSLILINTEKGKKILNNLKSINMENIDYQNAILGNPMYSTALKNKNTKFRNNYEKKGLEIALKKEYRLINIKRFIVKIYRKLFNS